LIALKETEKSGQLGRTDRSQNACKAHSAKSEKQRQLHSTNSPLEHNDEKAIKPFERMQQLLEIH